MPLAHSHCMFSAGEGLGQDDLLVIAFFAAAGAERQAVPGQLQLHVLLAHAGDFGQHQDVVVFIVDVAQRLADVLDHRVAGGLAADVAEGLDLQLALALAAQGGLDREAVDAAELALGVESLELAGVGEVLAFFRQVDQFFHGAAEASQQAAEIETEIAAAFAAASSGRGPRGRFFCILAIALPFCCCPLSFAIGSG